MTAQDDQLERVMEGGTLGGVVKYFYSREEYEDLVKENEILQKRVKHLEEELAGRQPWWGKLWAALRGSPS